MAKKDNIKDTNFVWEIHYMHSYYDDNPRWPGTVPVDKRYYYVADNPSEALEKAYSDHPELKKLEEGAKVETKAIHLENLVVARDSKNDGRLGYTSNAAIREINLSDSENYRLKVVVVEK